MSTCWDKWNWRHGLGCHCVWPSFAVLGKCILHIQALLALPWKHQLRLYYHKNSFGDKITTNPCCLPQTFLSLHGLAHHSSFSHGDLHAYPDLMCCRGHIYYVHSTTPKYPFFYSCSDNTLGVENINQTRQWSVLYLDLPGKLLPLSATRTSGIL